MKIKFSNVWSKISKVYGGRIFEDLSERSRTYGQSDVDEGHKPLFLSRVTVA